MQLSRKDNERLDRLASEVKKGGGLALPLFFSTILIELLDNGPTSNDRLIDIVTKVGANKAKKLAETWRGDWEFLTADLMEQLASQGYVSRDGDDCWHLGQNFREGVKLETIPYRKGLNRADHVLVVNREKRDHLGDASYVEHELQQLIRQPRARPHSPDTMKLLRDNYEIYGPIKKVIVDAQQRVIDGRHRREIDPDWPAQELRRRDGGPIRTDEEFLAAMLMLDELSREERLTSKEREKINRILGELPGVNATKRSRVETELLADAKRSNRAIAELVGVHDMTVGAEREKLHKLCSIHWYEFPGGKPRKDGTEKVNHLSTCWCGEGDAPPAPPKPSRQRQGPNQHPPLTDLQGQEFRRLHDEEGMSWTAAEAQVRGWDKERRSLTTVAMQTRFHPESNDSTDSANTETLDETAIPDIEQSAASYGCDCRDCPGRNIWT